MTNDKDILKGFMAGESAAFAQLLKKLRPAVLSKLRLHHGGLRHAWAIGLAAAIAAAAAAAVGTWEVAAPRLEQVVGAPKRPANPVAGSGIGRCDGGGSSDGGFVNEAR